MVNLHIVNGSGTAYGFKQSHLEGEMLVWNEALMLGPVFEPIGSQTFWSQRAAYFDQFDHTASYQELMVPELQKVGTELKYDRITLWFEHDYFCQINMMGVLSWISQYYAHTEINLVCIHEFPGVEGFRGLGQLQPEDFVTLWPQRVLLSSADLSYAQKAWEWFSGPSPLAPMPEPCPPSFKYWSKAMQLHLLRYPHENGLNHPQNWVLQVIEKNNYSHGDLMRHLLINQDYWGFGDLQYLEIINNLSSCFSQTDPYQLNAFGNQLLQGEVVFDYPVFHVGGSNSSEFGWRQGHLVPQTT